MRNKSTILKYALHAAILIGLVWAVVKYVNGQEVMAALQDFNYVFLPFMVGLAITYLLLKATRFVLLMSPFAGQLANRLIFKGYISGQAATLLPGGIAARAGLMNQIGVPISESSVPIAFNSGWDQVVFLLGGLIAALWFEEARLPIFLISGVLAIVGILLVVPQTRKWLGEQAERIAKRFDLVEQWHRFLNAIPQIFTKKIMIGCFIITLVAFAAQTTVLGLTLRGLELDVPVPLIFLAFIVPTMLGRLVPVPGGIGVTEAGMVGFLVSASQINTDFTVAAVAIFRVVTIVIPAALGAFIYFFFWKGEDELKNDDTSDAKPESATEAAGITAVDN